MTGYPRDCAPILVEEMTGIDQSLIDRLSTRLPSPVMCRSFRGTPKGLVGYYVAHRPSPRRKPYILPVHRGQAAQRFK